MINVEKLSKSTIHSIATDIQESARDGDTRNLSFFEDQVEWLDRDQAVRHFCNWEGIAGGYDKAILSIVDASSLATDRQPYNHHNSLVEKIDGVVEAYPVDTRLADAILHLANVLESLSDPTKVQLSGPTIAINIRRQHPLTNAIHTDTYSIIKHGE